MKIKLDYLLLPAVHSRAEDEPDLKFIKEAKIRVFTNPISAQGQLETLLRQNDIPFGKDGRGQLLLLGDVPISFYTEKHSLSELERLKKGSFTAEQFAGMWDELKLVHALTKVLRKEQSFCRIVDLLVYYDGGIEQFLWERSPEASIDRSRRFQDRAGRPPGELEGAVRDFLRPTPRPDFPPRPGF